MNDRLKRLHESRLIGCLNYTDIISENYKKKIYMSHDKAIQAGKEKRNPYTKGKQTDSTCRNHGSCPMCRDSRTHKYKKSELKASYEMEK